MVGGGGESVKQKYIPIANRLIMLGSQRVRGEPFHLYRNNEDSKEERRYAWPRELLLLCWHGRIGLNERLTIRIVDGRN